jgi:hypothetical protein
MVDGVFFLIQPNCMTTVIQIRIQENKKKSAKKNYSSESEEEKTLVRKFERYCQLYGSEFKHLGSRIQGKQDPGSGSASKKNLSIFNPKTVSKLSEK